MSLPYPTSVVTPTAKPVALLFFLPGSGETGDGTNLAPLAVHGPLQLIANGVTWFSDAGVVVIGVMTTSDNKCDYSRLIATVQAAQTKYGIGPEATYITGLSLGGGFALNAVNRYPNSFAGALVAAPASTGPANPTAAFKGKVWIYQRAYDPVVPAAWSVGVPSNSSAIAPWPQAWMTSYTNAVPLDTHPDAITAYAHTGGPKLVGVKTLQTGLYNPVLGWVWAPSDFLAAARNLRAVVLDPYSTAHGGWDELYGTTPSSFRQGVFEAFLGITIPIPVPVPVPVPAPTLADYLAQARAALDAIEKLKP